jgi:hypothetical protein
MQLVRVRAQILEEGGPRLWKAFMAELRAMHLGAPVLRRSVFTKLQVAFDSAVKRKVIDGK